MPRATFDLPIALRKTFALISTRPLPILGSIAILQLPLSLGLVLLSPVLQPVVARLQHLGPQVTSDAPELARVLAQVLLPVLGALIGYVVLSYFLYAMHVGAAQSVVFDAYRQQNSTLGGALRTGVSRSPSLVAYQLVKTLASVGAGFAVFALGLAVMSALYGGHGTPAVSVVLGLLFTVLMFVAIFIVWCALSLGAGAIVAERLGPLAGTARGFQVARGSFGIIVMSWLAISSVYIVGFCMLSCVSVIVTAPVQLATNATVGAVVAQFVQLAITTAFSSVTHVLGAVMYGELAEVGLANVGEHAADVFR